MSQEKNLESLLNNISAWCLTITACISMLCLMGWATKSVLITSISHSYKPIAPSTALCLFILSVSFYAYLKKPENHVRQIITIACVFVVICICLIIFICFISGTIIEAELLFFTPRRFPAGHMAPVTAAKLIDVSLGILFLTLTSRKKQLYNNLAAICAIISIITGLFVLIGYLYETPFLYRKSSIPVSIPGAISLVFLGMGLLTAAGPHTLPVRLFSGPSVRSRLTRVFFPVILAAVFINDVLLRLLTSFEKINPAFARSFIAIASAIIVGIIIAKLTKSIGTQIDNVHSELVSKDEALVQSNERFRLIAENINEGFCLIDRKLENVIYISPGYERILGRSLKDLYENPRSFYDAVHPDDRQRVIDATLIQKAGKPIYVEYRVTIPDGSIRWIEGQGFPVKNTTSGHIINHVAIIKDFTERKNAEQNLLSEKDFSDASLNSLPAIFTLVDSTGKYLRWNKNFETVTGYSAEEIKSLHPLDLIADPDKEIVEKQIRKTFADGSSDVEANLACKTGKHIPYYFTSRPIKIKGLPCIIGIGIDIARRRQAESALMREKETAQNYLDIAGVMIIVVNLDMKITLINRKACEVIEYEEKEIIGKNAIEIFVPENERRKVVNFVKKQLVGIIGVAEAAKTQTSILTKRGEKRVIEWNAAPLRDETGKIAGILTSGEDVTERIEMQNMLIQAKNEWEQTFDTINDAITIHDNNYNIIRANKTAIKLLGTSFSKMGKLKCYQLYHGCDSPLPECPCYNAIKTGSIAVHKMFEPNLNRHLEIKTIPRLDNNNQSFGIVHIVRDISDQMESEEKQCVLQNQVLHMQKMESIGRLAGGVAHDFNNLLSGILGFSELALLEIPKDHPSRERIELVLGLGEKAASLTNQLLAFSRKQLLVMKNINLNNVVTDIAKMLKRIIGEDIILELKPAKAVKHVLADQGQMEQVLLNLAVNARDAMTNGGVLSIEISDILINDSNIQQVEGVSQGEYVKIAVRDTGCGMDNKVLENIFEPFFTTKDFGKGTGLGLSTVYGIIKQHNGFIEVLSKINQGTTFNIYLPVAATDILKVINKDAVHVTGGDETILVVDDEPILLSIIERALKPLGYRLLIAVSPEEAIKINETYEGDIHLLLTDVIMPKMNGKDLADRILSKRPDVKAVFMSGYLAETTVHRNNDEKYEIYLQKPIRINVLRQKLREILDKNN